MVANIGRGELRAKMDRGDPFVLLEVLAPRYYRHTHLPGALNLPPGRAWRGRLRRGTAQQYSTRLLMAGPVASRGARLAARVPKGGDLRRDPVLKSGPGVGALALE